jgi:hypothetical protein
MHNLTDSGAPTTINLQIYFPLPYSGGSFAARLNSKSFLLLPDHHLELVKFGAGDGQDTHTLLGLQDVCKGRLPTRNRRLRSGALPLLLVKIA